MTTNNKDIIYKELSYKIVGLAMEVHSKLGFGFLEKVYENALMILFEKNEVPAKQQTPVKVYFEGRIVGDYYADILVNDKIILELKSADKIIDALQEHLNIKEGQTTDDLLFTLEGVRCIGCCAMGPVITVNKETRGGLDRTTAVKTIEEYNQHVS